MKPLKWVGILFVLMILPGALAWAVTPVDYTRTLHEAATVDGLGNVVRCGFTGTTCLALADTSLLAIPAGDPYAPGPVVSLPLSSTGNDIVLDDGFAYVATATGIDVFDIGTPDHPVLAGHRATPLAVTNLALAGDVLAGLAENGDVFLADAATLTPRGAITPPDAVLDMAGWWNPGDSASRTLYLGTDSGLVIVDLADPDLPDIVTTFVANQPGADLPDGHPSRYDHLDIRGSILGVAGHLCDLLWDEINQMPFIGYYQAYFTLDISSPRAPTYIAWSGPSASDLFRFGDGFDLVTFGGQFEIIDPGAWQAEAASSGTGSAILDAATGPGIVALAQGTTGLTFFDATDPAQVRAVNSIDPGYGVRNLKKSARFVLGTSFEDFGTGGGSALNWNLLDLADPLDPALVSEGSISSSGNDQSAGLADIDGDRVAVVLYDGESPFHMLKIIDAAANSEGGVWLEDWGSYQILGDVVWAQDFGDLVAYDASALPAFPEISRTPGLPSGDLYCDPRGSFLLSSTEIHAIDLSNPTAPVAGSGLPFGDGIMRVGDWTYVGSTLLLLRDDGLHAVDLNDPDNPALLSDFSPAGYMAQVVLVQDNLVVLSGTGFYQVLDYTDPVNPVALTDPIALAGASGSAAWIGDTLYIFCQTKGISAIDMTDPTHPAFLGTAMSSTGSIYSPISPGGDFYLCGSEIFPLQAAAPSAVRNPGEIPGPATPDLHLGPNPFNSGVVLSFDLATAGRVRVTAYDISGRLVGEVVNAEFPPGPNRVTWDARGSDGSPMASGTYLFVLEQDGRTAVGKAVLVK